MDQVEALEDVIGSMLQVGATDALEWQARVMLLDYAVDLARSLGLYWLGAAALMIMERVNAEREVGLAVARLSRRIELDGVTSNDLLRQIADNLRRGGAWQAW